MRRPAQPREYGPENTGLKHGLENTGLKTRACRICRMTPLSVEMPV
jgi:hypothetical protein